MGNTSSSSSNKSPESEFENFYDVIDYVATYYILTMDFKSLSKLSEKEYCDKLIILTADIIEKYFTEHEITYLEQRVKDGIEINTLNNEKFVFIDREKLDSLDISNETKKSIQKNIKKNRVCIGIAKFYVKIAHIFAAILMTINPIYSYTDSESGVTRKAEFMEKDSIPKNASKKVKKFNICDNRINALKNNEFIDEETGDASLEPEICDINTNTTGLQKTLSDEPGIQELMQLYFDKYDNATGTFSGMTDETKILFDKDLKQFYTAFTGEESMPPEISRFADIKLKDYNKTQPNCQGLDAKLRGKINISQKDDLFVAYAENLKRMIQTAADNQIKLLDVINDLFTYTIDPRTQKRIIRVNPELTELSLQKSVEKTRKLIMDLYIKCETDYEQGVKLFAAIVESKNAEIVPRQIRSLTDESEKLIQSVQKPYDMPPPAFVVANGANKNPLVDNPVDEKPFDNPLVDNPLVDNPLVDNPVVDNPLVDNHVVINPLVDEKPVVINPLVDEKPFGNPNPVANPVANPFANPVVNPFAKTQRNIPEQGGKRTRKNRKYRKK